MEDKRTRSDYIREIQRLERVNKHYEKIHKELIRFIEDEIYNINQRMKKSDEFLKNTQANYILSRNLDGYKKALHNVLKEINKM